MRNLAAAKGGECLSDVYVNSRAKMRWQCKEGHRWRAPAKTIRQGHWCRKCEWAQSQLRRRHTIEEMQQLAAARGGKCLSKLYVNNFTHLDWQCAQGHQFSLRPMHIFRGQWCLRCSPTAPKDTADMKAMAAARGGKFISRHYVNSETKYLWECAEGHRWFSVPGNIQQGGWCPQCAGSLGKRLVRLHFEQLFREKFPPKKPQWLLNSEGHRMQLDGYCARLNLAFECHGQQHFKSVPYFQQNQHSFSRRQSDDQRKRELCHARGVRLIEVPFQIPVGRMKEYILRACRRAGVRIPLSAKKALVNLQDVFLYRRMQTVQEMASAKGGRCVSKTYLGSNSKLSFECANHHFFWMVPTTIQQGHWCPRCAIAGRVERQRKPTIEEMRQIAASHGGKCLSAHYASTEEYLVWNCNKHKYVWRASGMRILRGHWCKKCGAHRGQEISQGVGRDNGKPLKVKD